MEIIDRLLVKSDEYNLFVGWLIFGMLYIATGILISVLTVTQIDFKLPVLILPIGIAIGTCFIMLGVVLNSLISKDDK